MYLYHTRVREYAVNSKGVRTIGCVPLAPKSTATPVVLVPLDDHDDRGRAVNVTNDDIDATASRPRRPMSEGGSGLFVRDYRA